MSFTVSQNFLTSEKIIRRLLCRTSINRDDHVIEIGAGKGHITKMLADTCRKVSAYEIDPQLCAYVLKKLGPKNGLHIKCQDFLKAPLPDKGAYKVFSNIPFNATTAILRKLTHARNPPKECWLVMEKGAAKRFMGTPCENIDSIRIKPFFDIRILYHFTRQDFHPMPSVDIVLLHMAKKEQPDIPAAQREEFVHFVSKNLKYGPTAAALRRAGLPPIKAVGTILYIQWLCLFRWYIKNR
jgi:23S rRNA (adenine-N6)-dimethyltransferase